MSETRIVSPIPSLSRIDSPAVRRDDALVAHARLGQAEVERVVGARSPAGDTTSTRSRHAR